MKTFIFLLFMVLASNVFGEIVSDPVCHPTSTSLDGSIWFKVGCHVDTTEFGQIYVVVTSTEASLSTAADGKLMAGNKAGLANAVKTKLGIVMGELNEQARDKATREAEKSRTSVIIDKNILNTK